MPLFARSFQELVQDSLTDLSQNTNLTNLSAGGKARTLLESLNRRLEDTYDTFDLNMVRAFLGSATGKYLDLFGQLLNEPREPERLASASTDLQVQKFYVKTGTFGSINNGNDITLPAGTIISSQSDKKGTTYRLNETTVLPAGQSSYWVGVIAQVPGDSSNVGAGSLKHHDFDDYEDSNNNSLLTTNVHAIANGKDIESDTNYRYRLSQKVLEAQAANETSIRLAVLTTPGVADVYIKRRYYGIGTTLVLVESTTPSVSNSLLAEVQARVDQVKSSGDKVYVRGPTEIGLSFIITVHYRKNLTDDEREVLQDNIKDKIEDHITELGINGDLSINRLAAEIFSVSDDISDLGEPGDPFDTVYIYKKSRLKDNKTRQTLLGDYDTSEDERLILEPSLTTPIVLKKKVTRS